MTLISPQQDLHRKFPECEVAPKNMIIYVCPTKGCENYFSSTDFRPDRMNLKEVQERRNQDGERVATHARIECPDCRIRGKKVERVPYIVTQVLPLEAVLKVANKNK